MPPISLGIGLSLSMQGRGGKAWRDYDLFETGSGFLYDFSRADTLFQEATGITPAGVDQNVGLALDISKWGGKTLAQVLAAQAELVVNGGFDNGTTGWSTNDVGATIAVVAGELQLTADAGAKGAIQQIVIPANTTVRLRVGKVRLGTSASGLLRIDTIAGSWAIMPGSNPITLTGSNQAWETICRTGAAGITINIYLRAGAAGTCYLDDVSVKEIPGNHASQATSGARPVRKAGLTRYDGSDDGLVMTVNPSAATTFLVEGKLPSSNSRYFGGVNGAGTSRLYLGTNSDVLAALVGSGTALLGTAALSESGVFGVMNDGTTASLIQNGAIVASQAQAGAPTTAFPIALGFVNNSGTPAGWGNSDIYKALAINRALTPAEIVKLTNYWNTH